MESCCASEFFAFMHSTAPHRGLGGFACFAGSFGALLSSGRIQVDCRSKQECGPVLRFLFFHRIESDDQRFERELAECGVSKCHQIYTWTFWHFWALCITLHIFAHLCTRWCREHWWTLAHQIASCGRLLPAFTWCGKPGAGGLVPCRSLSQLFWLDVAWTMSIDSEFSWRSVATVFLSVAFGLILLGLAGLFPEDPAAPKHSAGSPVRDRHRSWGGTFVAESHGKLTEIFLCHRLCLGSWQTWQAYDVYEAGQTQIVYTQNWVA